MNFRDLCSERVANITHYYSQNVMHIIIYQLIIAMAPFFSSYGRIYYVIHMRQAYLYYSYVSLSVLI